MQYWQFENIFKLSWFDPSPMYEKSTTLWSTGEVILKLQLSIILEEILAT